MASKYELFFREADKDGSGYLTLDELIKLLREKGYKKSDDSIKVSELAAYMYMLLRQCRSKNIYRAVKMPDSSLTLIPIGRCLTAAVFCRLQPLKSIRKMCYL